VAVKSIFKKELVLEEAEWKLMEEIKIMRELSHPNIVALYGVYDEPEQYHLVMDLMVGGDLLTRLSVSSTLTEQYSRFVCRSIIDALVHMHSKTIAHRDLKPENVLLESDRVDSKVKLADFGFAKKVKAPNSFTTLCGTRAYVAPEIIESRPYGVSCDMWSLGVMAFAMMGGYQPFFGETEEEVQSKTKTGNYTYDDEYFKHVTPESKAFIDSLLVVDPASRPSASAALEHPWFKARVSNTIAGPTQSLVFFMIGSQRSGSNWLRTMLDEREDLAGPHPPHMMRDFVPLLDRYGDLKVDDNFRILVDHVSTFVERNQVPWTNKHGRKIVFPRFLIFDSALASSKRISEQRKASKNPAPLPSSMYMLCVFDAIMNYFTKANGKHIWMCKSMGMSKFHDLLLEFYGSERLRYIYLVRDPRDVAMSFMKT
jgi:serine/threonine protein kinase